MTSFYEKVFTDAVKDVIGNDPVLDQFDISYVASFYGTLQDSYITGSILSVQSNSNSIKSFVTGTRGKLFNKFDANLQSPLDDTYGCVEVSKIPNLSHRLTPWKERVSNAYRISQAYDSRERFYDSCLPDIEKAFAADGAQIWTVTSSSFSSAWLSPYRNVVTESVGYMYFNSSVASMGSSGTLLTNNSWTWSYPYESKYFPLQRLLDNSTIFNKSFISANFASSSFIESTLTSRYEYLGVRPAVSSSMIQPPYNNITTSTQAKKLNKIFPLLPGKHGKNVLGSSGRNSLRYYVPASGSLGVKFIPTTAYGDSALDDTLGWSMIIPSDIKLNEKISHDFLPTGILSPGPEYLTGTMTYSDTIKFLFGFGDFNNLWYGDRIFNPQAGITSYVESFGSYSNGTPAKNVADYITDSTLTVRWSNADFFEGPTKAWRVISTNQYGYTNTGQFVYYISGSKNASGELTGGIVWNYQGNITSTVLISDTDTTYGGNLSESYLGPDLSSLTVDITSSYPWTLRYDRAVGGHTTDGLFVYFSEIPGMNTNPNSYNYFTYSRFVMPLEFVRGKSPLSSAAGSMTIAKLEKFDLMSSVSTDEFPKIYSNVINKKSGSIYDYPLAPGKWRLNFSYVKSGSGSPPTTTAIGNEDRAVISNLEIITFKEEAFPPINTIGANNYPEFRTTRIDSRYNPVGAGFINTNTQLFPNAPVVVTGSSDLYSGYIFGISPIIRGWKYGLYSGFASNSKVVFRRDRFGQFRDMLEQRLYSKYVDVGYSPATDGEAISYNGSIKEAGDATTSVGSVGVIGSAPVTVRFINQSFTRDSRGIGDIINTIVDPSRTYSQNLSNEATSSLPYFDGIARYRTEAEVIAAKK